MPRWHNTPPMYDVLNIDRRKFERWLKAKRPDQIVGQNRDCHCCPIATFYAGTAGNEIVVSNECGEYIVDDGDKHEPPEWAANFFDKVDGDEERKITARRALEILATIPQ